MKALFDILTVALTGPEGGAGQEGYSSECIIMGQIVTIAML